MGEINENGRKQKQVDTNKKIINRKRIYSNPFKVFLIVCGSIYVCYAVIRMGAVSNNNPDGPPPVRYDPVTGVYTDRSNRTGESDYTKGITVGIVLPLWFGKNKVPLLSKLNVLKECLPSMLGMTKSRIRIAIYFGTEPREKTNPLNNTHLSDLAKPVVMNNETLIDMMNTLTRKAYLDGVEYLVTVADTDKIWSDCDLWIIAAIRALKTLNPPNIGVAVPVARDGSSRHPVSEMVHRTHLDIFYYYYPQELEERNVQYWMDNVYTNEQFVHIKLKGTSKDYVKVNTTGTMNKDEKLIALNYQSRLQSYLVQHDLISPTDVHSSSNQTITDYFHGAVVVMAPQRNKGLPGYPDFTFGVRLCLFLHMVQTVDKYLNVAHGTHYPIFVIISADPYEDPDKLDAEYTAEDKERIRSWAPNTDVRFIEVNMYTKDALTAGTNRTQILRWAVGKDGAIGGRPLGYRSMCRLWSGRLQQMPFIQRYTYYMRLDDDSYFTKALPKDPFIEMKRVSLLYAFIRRSPDPWGYDHLKNVSKPYGKLSGFVVPYTNFHIARSEFFVRDNVIKYWKDLEHTFSFYKYRVGDATLHGALLDLFMKKEEYTEFKWIPYVHNSNDEPGYPPKHWKKECGHIDIRKKSGS